MDCFSPVFERMKTNGNSLDILLLQGLAIMQYFSSALLQLSFNYLEADIWSLLWGGDKKLLRNAVNISSK